MTLRILKPGAPASFNAPPEADTWATRIGKLIPGEALGLYGAGLALIPDGRSDGVWILAVASLLLAMWLRYLGTRDAANKPQWPAIGIAAGSFVLWVLALQPPSGPIDLGENGFLVALAALIWGTAIPYFYKG